MYYINCFFMYSVLGFLMESFVYKFMDSANHSGFLYGPITPIYGVGAVVILITNKKILKKMNFNKFFTVLLQFLIFTILLTIIEFIGGFLLKELLNIELWNYNNKKYNIGKYISLDLSLIWGMFSILFIYIIHPFINKFIKKMPNKVTYIFIAIFLIDLFLTIIK